MGCAANKKIPTSSDDTVSAFIANECVKTYDIVDIVLKSVTLAILTGFRQCQLVDEFTLINKFVTQSQEIYSGDDDDTYIVDNTNDTIEDTSGTDTVRSSAGFNLSDSKVAGERVGVDISGASNRIASG